jgi:hypothetical protein
LQNTGQDCLNPLTLRISGSGTYAIVGGTGRFDGASGTGTFTVTAQVESVSGTTTSGTFNPLTFDGGIILPGT